MTGFNQMMNEIGYSQEMNQMCNQKAEKLTKIELLIAAIDRLERTINGRVIFRTEIKEVEKVGPADKLKAQIDRLEKLLG